MTQDQYADPEPEPSASLCAAVESALGDPDACADAVRRADERAALLFQLGVLDALRRQPPTEWPDGTDEASIDEKTLGVEESLGFGA